MPAGLPFISCSALELLHEIGGPPRIRVVDAELGVDPDRLPRALERPRIVTRPLLRNGNIIVDSRAVTVVDAEGAVEDREGVVEVEQHAAQDRARGPGGTGGTGQLAGT